MKTIHVISSSSYAVLTDFFFIFPGKNVMKLCSIEKTDIKNTLL